MVLKSQKAIIGCVIKCKNSYFFLSSTTHRIDVLNFHCKCASKYPCISSNIGIKFKQLLALLAERMSPLTSEKIGRHLVHQAFLFYPHPILTPEAQTWRYRDYLCPMEQIRRSGSLCCLSALQYEYSSLSSCQFSEVLDQKILRTTCWRRRIFNIVHPQTRRILWKFLCAAYLKRI